MHFINLAQGVALRLTLVAGVFASGVEATAWIRIDGARDLAADRLNSLIPHGYVRNGDCRKQRLCIGMLRILEQFLGRCLFHALSEIHDRDVARNMLHHGKMYHQSLHGCTGMYSKLAFFKTTIVLSLSIE